MLSREKPRSKSSRIGYRLTRIRLIKPCIAARETRHDVSDVTLDFSKENSESTRSTSA